VISVLLATMGRPDMAEATVSSLYVTTAGHEIQLVVATEDDETGDRIVQMDLAWGQEILLTVDERDEQRGSSKAWNDALALAEGDPIVLAADDLEF
jgi:hypothetical protein